MPSEAPRALVIDNDASICDLLQLVLGEDGWDVQTRVGGHAALELLPQWAPDVILLDLRLIDMEAERFLAAFRQQQFGTPVVLFSAVSNLAEHVKRLGAHGSLSKPFELGELSAVMCQFLSQDRLDGMASGSSDGG